MKEPHFLSFKEQQFPHQVIPLASAITPSPHLSPSHSISLIWMPLLPNCLPSTAAPPPPFLTSSFVHSTLLSEFGGLLLQFRFKLYYAQLAPSPRLDSICTLGIALKIRGGALFLRLRLDCNLPFLPPVSLLVFHLFSLFSPSHLLLTASLRCAVVSAHSFIRSSSPCWCVCVCVSTAIMRGQADLNLQCDPITQANKKPHTLTHTQADK